jgi:hypothetical protein
LVSANRLSQGVYISVPFCGTKCSFRNFASGVFSRALFDRYAGRVCAEIEAADDMTRELGKRGRAAVCRYLGKVHPGFPFDPAKHVGGATELVLMIPSDRTSRLHGERFANLRV